MKKLIAPTIAATLLISGCSEPPAPKPTEAVTPEIRIGLALADRSQCLSCHTLDRKVIGPAWNDVSSRYNDEIRSGKATEAQIEDQLARKIAMGGKGNWTAVTGGMSMPPNYPRVTRANIRKLARFILFLKK